LQKQDNDFGVPKLESLWWVESDKPALEVPREEWRWKLLIRMPKFVTSDIVEKVKAEVIKKKGIELVKEIKFEKITEGKCVQILHVGPYSTEPESLSKMRKLMGRKILLKMVSTMKSIFLTQDECSEEKMKTILRQPVKERA
jgi:hypothetical protein